MASRKKTPARKKPAHSDADHTHGEIIITISIGKLEYIKGKRKKSKKATPKSVKDLLKWALSQL